MAQPSYTIIVEPDDNGWLAYMPALPGCHAPGNTIDEALQELQVVFEMLLEEYAEEQTPLPPDVSVTVGAAKS
jgi:predicted RNase H-like HicB family nuclease